MTVQVIHFLPRTVATLIDECSKSTRPKVKPGPRFGRSERGSIRMTRFACILAALVSPAFAQSEEAAEPVVPSVQDPAARAELDLSRIPAETRIITPAEVGELEPVAPGLTGGEDWLAGLNIAAAGVPTPSRLPEGMILRERRGTIWPGPAQLWIFLPDPHGRLPGEGAMLIAPSRTRDQMTAMLEGQPDGQPLVVSGETLAYHEQNYLLLGSYRRPTAAESAPARAELEAPASEAPASGAPVPQDGARPTEVDALVRDLEGEARAGSRREDALRDRLMAVDRERTTAPAQAAGPDSFPPLLADGSYIAQRRARLARGDEGAWMLRFDGDADRLGDGRLTIIPCRALMLMENRAGLTPETPMTVSGRVYTSGGRGYFLPAMFRLEPRGDVNPIQ